MANDGPIKHLKAQLQLPADTFKPVPRIIISGSEEILIGGHVLLRRYTPELLCAQRAKLTVSVRGKNLEILSMDALGICVGGSIEAVEFEN